jgi:pantothenate kinase
MVRSQSQIYQLATDILDKLTQVSPNARYFLGITGDPASGKSTLAHDLTNAVNRRVHGDIAIMVSMDGFHLPNEVLYQRGLYPLKGIPDTFDVEGFITLLRRLHKSPFQTVTAPFYDRALHDPVHDGISIQPHHRLIIVEGNYLLYNKAPWSHVRPMLNEVWYVDASRDVITQRLLERHMKAGRSREDAEKKIASTDFPNAEIIEGTRLRADRIIEPSDAL